MWTACALKHNLLTRQIPVSHHVQCTCIQSQTPRDVCLHLSEAICGAIRRCSATGNTSFQKLRDYRQKWGKLSARLVVQSTRTSRPTPTSGLEWTAERRGVLRQSAAICLLPARTEEKNGDISPVLVKLLSSRLLSAATPRWSTRVSCEPVGMPIDYCP